MARVAVVETSERARSTYQSVLAQLQKLGIDGKPFQCVPRAHAAEEARISQGFRVVRDRLEYVFPEWEASGCFSHVPVGTCALFLARRDPWDPLPTLTATIVLGDHRALGESELLKRLIDPERRIGLGPWYEVTAGFEDDTWWSHGFYARRTDPRRRRLDRIWRRHQRLLARCKTPAQSRHALLMGFWERLASRWSF